MDDPSEFKEKVVKTAEQKAASIAKQRKTRAWRDELQRKKVIHFETGIIYPSATECAIALGVTVQRVSNSCLKQPKAVGSIKVRYYEELKDVT